MMIVMLMVGSAGMMVLAYGLPNTGFRMYYQEVIKKSGKRLNLIMI